MFVCYGLIKSHNLLWHGGFPVATKTIKSLSEISQRFSYHLDRAARTYEDMFGRLCPQLFVHKMFNIPAARLDMYKGLKKQGGKH